MLIFASVPEYSGILNFDLAMISGIVVSFINLAIIIAILSWLLYKPVLKFLNDRRERIRGELEQAEENLKASEETKAQYNAKLEGIKAERDEILDYARKTAGERESEIIVSANKEAGLILERARREIEQEREKAKDEIKGQIIQVSAMMAERLMGNQMDDEARDRLLNQAITELGDAQWRE